MDWHVYIYIVLAIHRGARVGVVSALIPMGKSCVRISVSVPRTTTKITTLTTNSQKQGLAALMAEIRGEVILSPPGFHLEARRRGMI